jgi:DNA-binding LacI/PurR family transcriptional regulator
MEEGKFESLADIARKEKVGTSYVSKVFNLNFISPRIIKKILTGTQPRNLRLQDIIAKQIPDLWEEQEEMLRF